jgi:feruloyl esterase
MRAFSAWIPVCILAVSCRDRGRQNETGQIRAVSAAPTAVQPAPATPVRCEDLRGLRLPHVSVTDARVVAATVPPYPGAPSLPAYCRVLGASHPTADSDIRFEVAIPLGDAWDGRYEQVGNGAFAGRIPEGDILDALATGAAAAGTDDGHQAGPADASWALGHPEKLVDFGYRAVKETHDAAVAIVRANRGQAPRHSYFTGCSDGGREALMEAQRFPEDFDGIVAAAPAIFTTHVLFGFAWNARALDETPASYIPRAKLEAIETAALAACGGDEDGVIDDPPACRFDPAVLRCAGADRADCLTEPQIVALRKIYGGARNPRTGEPIEPGFEPGAESEPHGDEPDGWSFWIAGGAPGAAGNTGDYRLSRSFFAFMVFDDPAYDLHRVNFDGDVVIADARVAAILNPDSPDLRAFEKRGGKLIHHHGWEDAVLPPRDSIAYFERVRATMGDTSGFYRLFMAPGMLHCEGGRGPNVLASRGAIRAWVEQGTPPERLIATKFVHDSPAKDVVRARPLCPYPQRAVYAGTGDRALEASYACSTSATR